MHAELPQSGEPSSTLQPPTHLGRVTSKKAAPDANQQSIASG